MQILQLSNTGGRLIIASDGVWDILSFEAVVDCSRTMAAETAAAHIVKVCSMLAIPPLIQSKCVSNFL